jgi:hypothetical protein
MSEKRKARVRRVENNEEFAFRVKIGDFEVEIKGQHADVAKTIEDLPNVLSSVQKACENAKPKTVATITVKTEPPNSKSTAEESPQSYPKITPSANCETAVIKILETDWGKWRPRTIQELKDAMSSNGQKFSDHMLNDTLKKLGDKGIVRRWNTNTGFVYILGEGKEQFPQ